MTLTETATITKRFLRVFAIFVGAFLVLWIGFLIVYNHIIVPYQRSQTKPERRFGPLPKTPLPPTQLSSSSLSYSLDTRSGSLPSDFSKMVNVYFIPPSESTLLAPDRARQLANSLGFTLGPEILSPSQYRFRDARGGTLQVDLTTTNFSFKRASTTKADSPQDEFLPDDQKLGSIFHDYLASKQLLKAGLPSGIIRTKYDHTNNQDSQTAMVSIWPEDVNKLPIVTADPKISTIHTTVTKFQDETLRFSDLQYSYWPVDLKTFSTYGLEPISTAYQQLQQGSGTIVYNQTQGDKASITNVFLAYYLPDSYISFLEPVYVFDGDKFRAYVPALTADSYAQ